jgi:hypothetical protein
MVPAAVRAIPVGSEPEVRENAYPGVPPVAERDVE